MCSENLAGLMKGDVRSLSALQYQSQQGRLCQHLSSPYLSPKDTPVVVVPVSGVMRLSLWGLLSHPRQES